MKHWYEIGAEAAAAVYDKNTDLGTTEFNLTTATIHTGKIQILAIAGTNELSDWKENLTLSSELDMKKVAVEAAREVRDAVKLHEDLPLLVVGHSKAGASAVAYMKMFGAKWCMAFCPARSIRNNVERHMKNTYVFIDPDDWVPRMGWSRFSHPMCTRITFPDNWGPNPWDHSMKNVLSCLRKKTYTTSYK